MSTLREFIKKMGPRSTPSPKPTGFNRRRWGLVACGVIATGFLPSLVWAQGVAHTQDVEARQAFERSAIDISSGLHSAIRHQEDFVVATGAFVANNPDATSTELEDWTKSLRMEERYPELIGVGALAFVQHDDLADFKARLQNDPAVGLAPEQEFVVSPAGLRPFYCLLHATVTLESSAATSVFGIDYCAGAVGPLILAARDSGVPSIFAVPSDSGNLLVVQTPIYLGGVVPDTLAARQSAYLGNLGVAIAPEVLMSAASRDDPDVTITLTHAGELPATFTNGPMPDDADSVHEDLGNGWSATINRPALQTGLMESASASGGLAAGLAASVLMGLLVYALGTGRLRAMQLVARRTDELRHQALHDGLTGLPNRVMILDRIEHLIARSRRYGTAGAALYVDLDLFKDVNDTLGHEAGDQLLRSVAERLTTGLRDVDTIGRMGGDEFVVLVDGGSPELVASRLLDLMREPFDIELSPQPIVVTTTIGIAVAGSGTATDLLREADIALYSAKAGGRDCYRIFQPETQPEAQPPSPAIEARQAHDRSVRT